MGASHRRFAGRLIALLSGVAFATAAADVSAPQINREQQVKAAYLYNFARFTSWPPEKLPHREDPVRFCVLRSDPLAPAMHEALDGKAVDEHPVQVAETDDVQGMHDCHVAYLGHKGPQLQAELALLADAQVLTVHEGDAAQQAGVVRLYIDGSRLRFEINVAAAERSHLTLSARLLGVARVVRD